MTDAFNGIKISFAPSTPSLLCQSKPGDQAADALQTLQWPLALGCLRQIFCSAGCVLEGFSTQLPFCGCMFFVQGRCVFCG